MKALAITALLAGLLLALSYVVALGVLVGRGVPAKGRVLAATKVSFLYLVGGGICFLVFGYLWFSVLAPYAAGAQEVLDGPTAFWSMLLALLGMASLWMALVSRTWCTSSGLVRRTWTGRIQEVPYARLQGQAEFHFDDVILPCEEEKVVLDASQPGFWTVMDCLEGRGVDFSRIPMNLKRKLDRKRPPEKRY